MPRPSSEWRIAPVYTARNLLTALAILGVLLFVGARLDLGRMVAMTADGVRAAATGDRTSEVANGFAAMGLMLPIQLEESTPVERIDGFDPLRLPPFSRLETRETRTDRFNPETLQSEVEVERSDVLVQPFGYLALVLVKLVETIEIAVWGTLLAVLVSTPLAILSAETYTPNRLVRHGARAVVSLCRAIPELVSALFLVMAYGFGPIAGVLALAIYGVGFLGKFYAEDIENAEPAPQDALRAVGVSRLKILRFAVLPQIWPQNLGHTLYLLDRNARMATVVGLVGAGGIGQELKGRFEMYNYGHVGTILLVIFLLVFGLDQISARIKRRSR
jgi:phosphonate transport system permease protein